MGMFQEYSTNVYMPGGMFHWVMFIRWNIFEQVGIGMTYLRVFLITMHEIDTAAEVHLQHFQTYSD